MEKGVKHGRRTQGYRSQGARSPALPRRRLGGVGVRPFQSPFGDGEEDSRGRESENQDPAFQAGSDAEGGPLPPARSAINVKWGADEKFPPL